MGLSNWRILNHMGITLDLTLEALYKRRCVFVLIDNNKAEVAVKNLIEEALAPRAMAMAA